MLVADIHQSTFVTVFRAEERQMPGRESSGLNDFFGDPDQIFRTEEA
jgi:hypothetical protein